MKKLTTTILLAAMILSLTACGNNNESTTAPDSSEPTSSVSENTSKAEESSSATESTVSEESSAPEDTTTSAVEEVTPPAEEDKCYEVPAPSAVTKVDYTLNEVCTGKFVCAGTSGNDFYTAYDTNTWQTCYLDSDFNEAQLGLKMLNVIDGKMAVYYNESKEMMLADKDGAITKVGDAYNTKVDDAYNISVYGDIITDGKNECYYDFDGNKIDLPYYGGFIDGYAWKSENGKVTVMDTSGNITEYAIDHDFSANDWTAFLGGEYIVTYSSDTEKLTTYKTDGTFVSEIDIGSHFFSLMYVSIMPLSDGTYFNDGLMCINMCDESYRTTRKYINVITGEYVFGYKFNSEYYTPDSAYFWIPDFRSVAGGYYDVNDGEYEAYYEAGTEFINGVALVYDEDGMYLINEQFEKIADVAKGENCYIGISTPSNIHGVVGGDTFIFSLTGESGDVVTYSLTINSAE